MSPHCAPSPPPSPPSGIIRPHSPGPHGGEDRAGIVVVTIHGLGGGPESFSDDVLRLAAQQAGIDVKFLHYEWGYQWCSIFSAATSLKDQLLNLKVPATAAVFFCHSAGGLVAAEFVVNHLCDLPQFTKLTLILCGTPLGSHVPFCNAAFQSVRAGKELEQDAFVSNLCERFLYTLKKVKSVHVVVISDNLIKPASACLLQHAPEPDRLLLKGRIKCVHSTTHDHSGENGIVNHTTSPACEELAAVLQELADIKSSITSRR